MTRQTSRLANDQMTLEFKQDHYAKIMQGFYKIGYGTSEDVAKACNLSEEQTRKRLIELARDNKIVLTEHTKKRSSGRLGQIWALPGTTVKLTA